MTTPLDVALRAVDAELEATYDSLGAGLLRPGESSPAFKRWVLLCLLREAIRRWLEDHHPPATVVATGLGFTAGPAEPKKGRRP